MQVTQVPLEILGGQRKDISGYPWTLKSERMDDAVQILMFRGLIHFHYAGNTVKGPLAAVQQAVLPFLTELSMKNDPIFDKESKTAERSPKTGGVVQDEWIVRFEMEGALHLQIISGLPHLAIKAKGAVDTARRVDMPSGFEIGAKFKMITSGIGFRETKPGRWAVYDSGHIVGHMKATEFMNAVRSAQGRITSPRQLGPVEG